jgi:hypothetical protein
LGEQHSPPDKTQTWGTGIPSDRTESTTLHRQKMLCVCMYVCIHYMCQIKWPHPIKWPRPCNFH